MPSVNKPDYEIAGISFYEENFVSYDAAMREILAFGGGTVYIRSDVGQAIVQLYIPDPVKGDPGMYAPGQGICPFAFSNGNEMLAFVDNCDSGAWLLYTKGDSFAYVTPPVHTTDFDDLYAFATATLPDLQPSNVQPRREN